MDAKILIIDDDQKLQKLVRDYLEGYGFRIESLSDGRDAVREVRERQPDLIVLDIMMPGKDGIEVLRDLRRESAVPVVMLTARGDDTDRIVGLEMGADDYLPKPFNPRELLARIKAILRRTIGDEDGESPRPQPAPPPVEASRSSDSDWVETAGLRLHPVRRVLVAGDVEQELSTAEARLLEVFMEHVDEVLSRDEIMNRTKGRDFMAFERSIDVQVSKLRGRLSELPGHKDRIKTVWGTGYLFRGD